MQGAVVAGGVADEGLTVVAAAGGPTAAAAHTPPVAFVFIVPGVGEVVLRGPIQHGVVKVPPVKVLLRAGGGGGAAGGRVLGQGDLAGGSGPGGAVDALLVVEAQGGEVLLDVIVGGEPVVLAWLSCLLFLLIIPQGHGAIGQPAHAAAIPGVPQGVSVQDAHAHGSVLHAVGAHFGSRPLQGRGPPGL